MDLRKLNRPPAKSAKLGVALVILVSLYSSLQFLRASTEPFADSEDNTSSFEKRFEGVKSLLPRRGTIGYISDDPAATDYFLANYALSPILVEKGDGPRMYLVNVTQDMAISVAPDHPGAYTVRRTPDATVYDFGRGVLLVERDSN